MSANGPELILASTSKARARVLLSAGLSFAVEPSDLDENPIKKQEAEKGSDAEAVAHVLAKAKALSISARHPGSMVIGCDQMLDCDGVWYNKPATDAMVAEQLKSLRGKTHKLVSAVSMVRGGEELWHSVGVTRLTMRDFSDDFLDDYIDKVGRLVKGSVGAYHFEGLGIQLFEKIDGDYFTILGLPLLPVLEFLRSEGLVQR